MASERLTSSSQDVIDALLTEEATTIAFRVLMEAAAPLARQLWIKGDGAGGWCYEVLRAAVEDQP